MRKKHLGGLVAIMLLAVGGISLGFELTTPVATLSDLQYENIEALTDGESGSGTPVDNCYLSDGDIDSMGWYKFCDSKTSSSMIYPCPSSTSFGPGKSKTMCTKK